MCARARPGGGGGAGGGGGVVGVLGGAVGSHKVFVPLPPADGRDSPLVLLAHEDLPPCARRGEARRGEHRRACACTQYVEPPCPVAHSSTNLWPAFTWMCGYCSPGPRGFSGPVEAAMLLRLPQVRTQLCGATPGAPARRVTAAHAPFARCWPSRRRRRRRPASRTLAAPSGMARRRAKRRATAIGGLRGCSV